MKSITCHKTFWWIILATVETSVFAERSNRNIIPSSSLPPLPARKHHVSKRMDDAETSTLISNIRGGGGSGAHGSKTKISKKRSANLQQVERNEMKSPTTNTIGDLNNNNNNNNDVSNLTVQSILIPRQTSYLKPLRFLSFLLMNQSFASCANTAGKPLEDAIRRILNMPPPGTGATDHASKVTPLHHYVAKKIVSSKNSVEMVLLPPGHLPSPLSLLGLLCSILLYVGGSVLLPKWNVELDVLFNYERFDIINGHDNAAAGHALQNWFDENMNEDGMVDPYFDNSSKKRLGPAVFIHEMGAGKIRGKVGPLFYSPGYDVTSGHDNEISSSEEQQQQQQHLQQQHPRRYYFELDQKRYYYDPTTMMCTANNDNDNSQSQVISGGPNLHNAPLSLLSRTYTHGLHSPSSLTYATQRYSPYSEISIPVPSLLQTFTQRISSPLVALQLLGRLLSLVEEESIGRAIANLGRLGMQHFMDAKRSVGSAITLAEEVRGVDGRTNDDNGEVEEESRFWALRPITESSETKGKAGKVGKVNATTSEWVRIAPKELLPGDVFAIAPTATGKKHKRGKPSSSSSLSTTSTTPVATSSSSLTIPVDALLLDGTCVTEEAALTGESVPQAKVPIDFATSTAVDDADGDTNGDSSDNLPLLDMSGIHRSSCVFAGTGLLHSSNWDLGGGGGGTSTTTSTMNSSSSMFHNLPPLPKETFGKNNEMSLPVMFLCLRTGSYSSRGEIIQSLLKSRMNMGVSNRENEMDSIRLIGVLALFAVGACVFLLLDSSDGRQKNDSVFKQIVQCTRIAVASVPSDLPASLSACAYACSSILRQESDAVNSEAGALLESSKVDTIVFDKTGTLTADTQALTTIAYPPNVDTRIRRFRSNIVLAGGHTLVGMGEYETNLVGDPVDLSGLHHTHWKYDVHEKSATSRENNAKLWQLRSFPFDPVKKMSSALVLVQNNEDDGAFQLWVVAKGSPSKIRDLVQFESEEKGRVTHSWYNKKVKRLGKLGYRSIGLGALDVTDTKAAGILFPSGLPSPNENSVDLKARINEARRHARESLVRSDIETPSSGILGREKMMFVGFACFNAPMRSSSPRVVKELKSSAEVIMLTGDEPNASFVMANKAGITNGKKSCRLLKTNDSGELIWEVGGKLRKSTLEMAKKIQQDVVEKEKAVMIVTGDAVNVLLSGTAIDDGTVHYVQNELLPQTALVASASPNDKSLFVKWLQSSCERNVLMCGDGVNDIAAMREATVSVAMLSGFGHESSGGGGTIGMDTEDMRRKERLKRRYIGSNRLNAIKSKPSSSLDEAGVGDSVVASCARIQHGIIKGMRKLQSKDKETPHHITAFDVCLASIKAEFKRRRDLKKGGSNAAKILAEEDCLRRSLESKSSTEQLGNTGVEVDEIQTGESCLASSFTLLRPCISGVESILRTGVSAAACGISLYRKVALNCMLSCYNLATLYKNGLRYGKWMWQVELYSIISTERASFSASSTPRPRLVAGVRPSTTPFHVSEVLSTILQAIIHIVTLTVAVNFGKELETKYPTRTAHKGFSIQWSDNHQGGSAGSLLSTLVGSSINSLHSDTGAPPQSFLKRSPFQPNYISNNVFIVSVFQNAVTTMVNHSGRPFSVSFLESRPLCLSVCLAFLLCTVCIAESIPMLNTFIQLASYPTKASKIEMLRLLLLNVSMSYFADYFSTFFFRHDIWKERNKAFHAKSHNAKGLSLLNSADEEEKLLSEERQQNCVIVSVLCLLIFHFSIQILYTRMKE